jgi:anti-sigma factor RsiW
MITQELKLKLQAYLDNELGSSDARKVGDWIERDAEAQALCAELKGIKATLQLGELEVKVPESREFYWSKIERAIRQEPIEVGATPGFSGRPWWWRLLVPLAGVAVVVIAAVSYGRYGNVPATKTSFLHEIETPLEDTSAISFHSQAAGMTVVWVQSGQY